ncbi:MAG: trypsin-like serine protease [Kofleriaceae bacterium]
MRGLFGTTIVFLLCAPAIAGPAAPIVGGTNAAQGKWPDVAAVLFGGQQECTGTLIAPNVVITAGHCNDAALDQVLLGTSSLGRPQDGEMIGVTRRIEFPSSQSSEDVTILVLAKSAAEEPRKLATGWATLDIKNGAAVELVGFGATDVNGNVYIDELQEVMSTITDFDCSVKSGCNVAARPAGELGAGGMGLDTCSGDSGGPMYLLTGYGTFLAGVTSRSYDDSVKPCGDGGIYERPDKIVDWAEQQTGITLARGPEPTPRLLAGVPGGPVEVHLDANDPLGDDHSYALTTPPAHGRAAVRDDGEVRVCLDASASPDSLTVTITDKHDSTRKLDWVMQIQPMTGEVPASCDPDAFTGEEAGGCCDAGRNPGGSLPLALGVLIVLRRRRS